MVLIKGKDYSGEVQYGVKYGVEIQPLFSDVHLFIT
jgi:hypothetical protein